MTAIEIQGLVKRFKQHRALDGLDLQVPTGSVFGFLGPNGAGKTTTIRILLGLAHADAGSARLLDTDALAHPGAANPQIGYLPDVPSCYPWMTAREYLGFCAALFDIDRSTSKQRIGLLLELAGLRDVRTPIGGYSRGMKQRLGIAQAMINAPRLLILDEPTSALDPMGRHDVMALIDALRGQATVFFSTHILSDVERVCDQVAVLSTGRVVAADRTDALRQRYGGAQRLHLELAEDAAGLAEALHGEPWLTGVTRQPVGWLLDVTDLPAAEHRIPAIVTDRGWGLRRLESTETSLEEVFVQLIEHESGEPR